MNDTLHSNPTIFQPIVIISCWLCVRTKNYNWMEVVLYDYVYNVPFAYFYLNEWFYNLSNDNKMIQIDVWKCLFRLKINLNIRYKNCKILKGEYQSDTYSFHLKFVSCSVHSIFDVSRLPSSIPFPPVVILFSSLKQEWYICWIIEWTKYNTTDNRSIIIPIRPVI